MLLSELEKASRISWYAYQLFCIKRCFGPNATINILDDNNKARKYKTFEDLISDNLAPPSLRSLDPYLMCVPSVRMLSGGEEFYNLIPSKYQDGPECPWVVAEKRTAEAKARAAEKRKEIRDERS